MKIGLAEITKLIEDCKAVGFDVKMGDIIYALCVDDFKDKSIPYKTLFDKNATDKEIRAYNRHKYTKFLKKYIDANFLEKEVILNDVEEKDETQKYEDISFEENKDAIIKMIAEAEKKYANGEIEWEKYSDRVSKLRIALNDRFKVSEKQEDQRIIVYAKFNHICEWTHKECYLQSKEFAMKHWGLIEDPNKQVKLEEEDEDNERENTTED